MKDSLSKAEQNRQFHWMGAAVFGNANKVGDNGTKYIALKEPEATVMRCAFNEPARGI